MLSRMEECRQRAEHSEEMAQETADVAVRNFFLDLVEQWQDLASEDRKRVMSAITSIGGSPVVFRRALYERTYRVLCDAGIDERLADKLATEHASRGSAVG